MKEYVLAVDIARKSDYYNLMLGKIVVDILPGSDVLGTPPRVVHRVDVGHIEKYQRITYEQGAKRVAALLGNAALVGNTDLLVDGSGVGDAAIEIIRKEGVMPIPIIFTSGSQVREVRGQTSNVFRLTPADQSLQNLAVLEEIHVPKVDLVDAGKLLAEQHRFRVVPGIKWHDDFETQIRSFRGKVNEITNRVKYEALMDSIHDDQVVCYLMIAWWTQRMSRQVVLPQGPLVKAEERLAEHLPYGRNR